MKIKVIIAQAHQEQMADASIKQELDSVQQTLDQMELQLENGKIYFLFVKGIYSHTLRKMTTASLLINTLEEAVCELHGVLRIQLKDRNTLVAKTTIDYDSAFLGLLRPQEALLTHLNIPVKGLQADEVFERGDVQCEFSDVRVTFENTLAEEKE